MKKNIVLFIALCGFNQLTLFSLELPKIQKLSEEERDKVLKFSETEGEIHEIDIMMLSFRPKTEDGKLLYLSHFKGMVEEGKIYVGSLNGQKIYYRASDKDLISISLEKKEKKAKYQELWEQMIKEREEKKSCCNSTCTIL